MSIENIPLHFSVQGELVMRLAREKLYYSNDLVGAIQLLMSCLETDELTPAARAGLALSILDGRKTIVGTYPGPDYGVDDVPEEKRPKDTLEAWQSSIQQKLEMVKKETERMANKLACIAEHLPESTMQTIDDAYRRNWADDDDVGGSIFGTESSLYRRMTEDISPGAKSMLDSFLDRMSSGTDPDDPDYGWLFPDGTFHGVEFGDHHSWAFEWLKKNDPKWENIHTRMENKLDISDAGDYLVMHYHAVLLHNPGMGVAFVTGDDRTELTKAQKEFLWDYYRKRGKNNLADKFFQDDD